jgi:A/G-specific adenine glycosylase
MSGAMEAGHSPGEVTEALMELGALVCLPKTPRCAGCPLEAECKARHNQETDRYPIRPVKKEKSIEYRDIMIAKDENGRYLMRKREESILHGMIEFPDETALLRDGFTVTKAECLTEAEHIFTHRIWRMRGYRANITLPSAEGTRLLPEGYLWASRAEMDGLAVPGAMRPFVNALAEGE